MASPPDARPLSELFTDLTREIGTLVRQELTLAKTELGNKAARAGRHVAVIAVGAAVAYGGLLAIIFSLVLLLATAGLAAWLAALLVGIGVIAAGSVAAMNAMAALRRESLAPTETIETLKETTTWTGQATR